MARDFDLFGDPIPRNLGAAGRNEHVPTSENVNRVRQLVLAGWTQAQIAEELGISGPTFRKHYFRDFKKARRRALEEMKARTIARLDKAADEGNVSAMKELLRIVEGGEIADGIGDRPPEIPKAPKTPKMGKKEQALHDARTAHEGTGWNALLN